MSKSRSFAALVAIVVLIAAGAVADAGQRYGFGKPVTQSHIAPWDIDVNGLTGEGLPPGSGSVAQGAKIWEAKCSSCHGTFGEGAGKYPVIAGGKGTLKDERPEKTVGSYWPYAPTLFDYIKRAMPFRQPQSLSNDEVYALTAYVLNVNDIVPSSAVLDAKSLAAVKMPNRDGFIKAEWDTKNVACMSSCKPAAKVTSDLVSLHVTPDEREVGNVGSTEHLAIAASPEPLPPATSASSRGSTAASNTLARVTFAMVQPVIAKRCTVCHSAKPSQSGFSAAPAGIKFDTPAEIKAQAAQIKSQSVTTHQMPLANMTHMTDKERALLGQWIAAGAPVP
ncbi:hypothetical protein WPS_14540 [Vulcanimicrobium alpinum]|uniref:Cytochrome c domain-containing protein n=1 Tax=Vulcanimicrobium alpinum TaxID=3016050 RepID=A0AAN2C9N7_UNVUL|nr:c-type cytochrome [Vulcanimicrobium alpinum]BDE06178.1 hypothetical protein WPS_14540 [Vulcanimicrobium alpinum]